MMKMIFTETENIGIILIKKKLKVKKYFSQKKGKIMVLIYCRECGRQISDKATICPWATLRKEVKP